MTPFDNPKDEPLIILTDDVMSILVRLKIHPPGSIAYFEKESQRPIFRDRLDEKEELFPWSLEFTVSDQYMNEGYYFKMWCLMIIH